MDEWITGSFELEIYGYCAFVLAETSILTVMLLAINRYFRVVRPAMYRTIYSRKSLAVMATTAWLLPAVIVCVGWTILALEFRPNPANPSIILIAFSSTSVKISYHILCSSSIAIASLVVTSCYVKIYRHHNTAAAPSSQEGHSSYGAEEAKITRILTILLIEFCLCYLPPFVTAILAFLTLILENSVKYWNFCFTFPVFASSGINPLIYATMSRPFRREFQSLCSICDVIRQNGKTYSF